jgi:O-antigen/teichoic acid export membrane protein
MFKQQIYNLTHSAIIYGFGQVLNRFLGFLLLPFFTLYLSPADYGILAILGLISFIATSLFSFGLTGAAGLCYYDGTPECKEKTIWTSFCVLLVGAAVLLSCTLFSGRLSELLFRGTEQAYLITMVLFTSAATILASPFMLHLQFEGLAKLFVLLTFVSTVVSVGLSSFFIIFLERGAAGMVEALLIAGLLNLFLFFRAAVSRLPVRVGWTTFLALIKYGLPLIPGFVMIFVLQHGNKFILQHLADLDAVGIYNVGFNIGLAFNLLVSGLQSAWLPYFMPYVNRQAEARILFGRILIYYLFVFGAVSLLFFAFAKPVVMIMTQPAFHESYKLIGPSAAAGFFSGIFFLLLPGIYFSKDIKYLTLLQTLAALISIGLNFILIPPLGIFGAGMALVLGFLSLAALTQLWNFLNRRTYMTVVYDARRIIFFFLLYASFAAVMLWERDFTVRGEIIFSVAASIALPFLLWLLLTDAESARVRSHLKMLIAKSVRIIKWKIA